MAQAFPNSTFAGFDYHEASIATARERAAEAGVADRVRSRSPPASGFPGDGYDLVTMFDCLHDMGDPVGAARHVREALRRDGTWMVVEPMAGDRVEDNLHPVGRAYYGFSTLLCTPPRSPRTSGWRSAPRPGPHGSATCRPRRLHRFQAVAETPFNRVFEVRRLTRRVAVVGFGGGRVPRVPRRLHLPDRVLGGIAVPKGIDDGGPGPTALAVAVDLALSTVFALQHSVMARPWFKRLVDAVVPPAVERSTYVLGSERRPGAAARGCGSRCRTWSGRSGPAWARALLWALYPAGWALLVLSTFVIGHFDLFGLNRSSPGAASARTPSPGSGAGFYRLVRHPIMVGFLIAFWAAPDMSVGRLLFAGVASGYIMVGVRFEEHDLKRQLGEPYERTSTGSRGSCRAPAGR